MKRLETFLFCLLFLGVGCATPDYSPWGNPQSEIQPEEAPRIDLPVPEGLQAVSGELRHVALHWEPVLSSDIDGYIIERSDNTDSEATDSDFQRIAIVPDRFRTRFVDDGATDLNPRPRSELGDGKTYYYRVRSFDQLGRSGNAPSKSVAATTAALPNPPETLSAYSHLPRMVALAWSSAKDPTVSSYVVYRSPSARGPFEPIAVSEGRYETTYVDTKLGDLRVFYYRVSAVNEAGGEGIPTSPQRAVTKPEPLPPVGLQKVETKLGVNQLGWEPNVESDLAGYRLYRIRGSNEKREEVAALDAETHQVDDASVGAGESLKYQILAFDADGLESALSDPLPVEGERYELEASASAEGVQLRWNPRADEGFQEARVLRLMPLMPLSHRELTRTTEGSFLDTEVKPGRSYRYIVVLVREDGVEAPPSLPIRIQIPAKKKPE